MILPPCCFCLIILYFSIKIKRFPYFFWKKKYARKLYFDLFTVKDIFSFFTRLDFMIVFFISLLEKEVGSC